MDVNWVLTIVLSVIGSIILSVIGNILTSPVQNWLAKRSIVSKKKRVESLNSEFNSVELRYKDRNLFYIESFLDLFRVLGLFCFSIPIMLLGMYLGLFYAIAIPGFAQRMVFGSTIQSIGELFTLAVVFLGAVSFYLSVVVIIQRGKMIRRVQHFDIYKLRVESQIANIMAKSIDNEGDKSGQARVIESNSVQQTNTEQSKQEKNDLLS